MPDPYHRKRKRRQGRPRYTREEIRQKEEETQRALDYIQDNLGCIPPHAVQPNTRHRTMGQARALVSFFQGEPVVPEPSWFKRLSNKVRQSFRSLLPTSTT